MNALAESLREAAQQLHTLTQQADRDWETLHDIDADLAKALEEDWSVVAQAAVRRAQIRIHQLMERH